MRAFEPALPLGVAYSGGADSTALLLACARKWPGQVQAIHVNHGLQAAAAEFELHCRSACHQWGVPLHVVRVEAHGVPGQSPEEAARIARYKALTSFASSEHHGLPIQSIAIAQHADDQVETMLLALGRGAGLAGLSGMPAHWRRSGIDFYRPFLRVAGGDLRRWLLEEGVSCVSDPTNTDIRYTRNHIRAEVLPALDGVFPQFRDTFTRSAHHAAEAQSLMDEVAAEDWVKVVQTASGLPQIRGLQALSEARQSNVLRYWLKRDYGVIPSAAQVQEMRKQLKACTTRGHNIHLKVGVGFLERSGATLQWQPQ